MLQEEKETILELDGAAESMVRMILNTHYRDAQWFTQEARHARDEARQTLEEAQLHYEEMKTHEEKMKAELVELFGEEALVSKTTITLRPGPNDLLGLPYYEDNME